MSGRRRRAVLLAVVLLGSAGCGGADDGDTLTVFAAASLTDVFTTLGDRFEDAHPGVDVRFNFAGSSALATQITQGAPADVFASADLTQMDVVRDAGRSADPQPPLFAANALQIAVPAGNPAAITGLADFARDELTLAICAPVVPCGAGAQELFSAAGIAPAPDTLEEDVRAALTKVELGEVDAALVYASDVVAAGDSVDGIDAPELMRGPMNRYSICTLVDAPQPEAARAFVDLVLAPETLELLLDAGFSRP